MISTSTNWKQALGCYNITGRNRLVPANDIKIEYEQIDAVAQNSATVSVNSAESWSNHSEVMNLSIDYSELQPQATLEPNAYVLNGNMSFNNTHNGWVSSAMSSSDGTFTTNPKITLTWNTVQSVKIPGLTIAWSSMLNEYASQFTVTAKASGSVVAQYTFSNAKVSGYYEGELDEYDTVEIEITKWCLPNRRVRIESIAMGMTVVLGKSNIMSLTQTLSSDLFSFTLPDDELTFEIDNVDEDWNPDNPKGVYAYITERQNIVAKYAFKVNGSYEWITAGTYYMSDWTTPQNGITASFTAKSLVNFMTKQFVPSSISGYTYGNSITLKALAEAAFSQANLPINLDGSSKWSVASDLADISVVIPYTEKEVEGVTTYEWDFDYNCAEVIQLCANAACAVIRPNTNGDICIIMPNKTITDYYIDTFVAYSNGEYSIDNPLKDVNVNNGEYIYTPSDSIDSGVEQSISNPLLQSTSTRVLNAAWVAEMLLKRKNISGEFRADPRLQPLDVVKIVNKYATNQVYIDSVTWTYGGAFTGSYTGRVLKTIPLIDQEGEYYSGENYAGEYGGDD